MFCFLTEFGLHLNAAEFEEGLQQRAFDFNRSVGGEIEDIAAVGGGKLLDRGFAEEIRFLDGHAVPAAGLNDFAESRQQFVFLDFRALRVQDNDNHAGNAETDGVAVVAVGIDNIVREAVRLELVFRRFAFIGPSVI